MKNNHEQTAMRVSVNTIVLNTVLSLFKLIAGIYGHSAAMLSDAVHSISDVFSTIIVMIGIKMANKKPDKEHPYGHERLECVAAIILSGMLLATGLGIGYNGCRSVATGQYHLLPLPGILALASAVISILVKEGMYWYTRAAARKIGSGAMMADAWHHRSDALSSVGSFAGILGARLGYPIFDSAASIIICIFIIKASVDIFKDAINKMTDRSCEDTIVEEIRAIILEHEQVYDIDLLRTRLFGDKIYVDIEISTDGNTSLYQSHRIAHNIHDDIESKLANVKHCMIHVNPINNNPVKVK